MVALLTCLISRCQFATYCNNHGILGTSDGVNVLDVFFCLRCHFILFQAGSWLCLGFSPSLPPASPRPGPSHQVLKSEQKYTKLTGNVGGHYHSAAARSLRQEPKSDWGLDCDWMAVFLEEQLLTPRKINMKFENTPLEEEGNLPEHHFQVPCESSGVYWNWFGWVSKLLLK